MGSRAKYRQLPELYVRGAELPFTDGTVMWLQVMNPFEVEEARRDAQVARSRFILAMKEIGSPEYDNLRGVFAERGTEGCIDDICDAQYTRHFTTMMESIEVDPEWKEKVDVIRRSEDINNLPEGDPERELLNKINREWMEELNKRVDDEQSFLRRELERVTEDELLERYSDEWLDRRGNAMAMSAYNVAEMFYAARVCDATRTEDDDFDHAACNGHPMRVWETKDEVRNLPEGLFEVVREKLTDITMSVRDAKNSDRLLSSSASSQQPSPVEESTRSTPTEAQLIAPGIS